MNRYNLVVLKNNRPYQHNEHVEFKPYKYYRCSTPTENDNEYYMVYAEWFTQAEFDYLFEFAFDRIIRDLHKFGLIVKGNPISYTAFKKRATTHKYEERGKKPLYLFTFHNGNDIYGFYPWCRDTKEGSLKYAYEQYLKVLDGNMLPVDQEMLQFGNWGTPIVFSNLRSL